MRAEQILELLKRQPFRPFTLYMSDGSQFEVRHPELILLTRSEVLLGFGATEEDEIPAYAKILSLIHVVRAEFNDQASAASRSS